MENLRNFIVYDNFYSIHVEKTIELQVVNMIKNSLSVDEITYNGDQFEIREESLELAEGENRTVYLIEKILPE